MINRDFLGWENFSVKVRTNWSLYWVGIEDYYFDIDFRLFDVGYVRIKMVYVVGGNLVV